MKLITQRGLKVGNPELQQLQDGFFASTTKLIAGLIKNYGVIVLFNADGSIDDSIKVQNVDGTILSINTGYAIVQDSSGVARLLFVPSSVNYNIDDHALADGTYNLVISFSPNGYEPFHNDLSNEYVKAFLTLTAGSKIIHNGGSYDFTIKYRPGMYVVIDASLSGNNGAWKVNTVDSSEQMTLVNAIPASESNVKFSVGGQFVESLTPVTDSGKEIYEYDSYDILAQISTDPIAAGQIWLAQIVISGGVVTTVTDKRNTNIMTLRGSNTNVFGSPAAEDGTLLFYNATTGFFQTLITTAITAARTLTMPDLTGILALANAGQDFTNVGNITALHKIFTYWKAILGKEGAEDGTVEFVNQTNGKKVSFGVDETYFPTADIAVLLQNLAGLVAIAWDAADRVNQSIAAKKLKVLAGTSSSLAKVGGVLNETYAAVQSVGTTETDLFSYSIPANVLSTNGDKIIARYAVNLIGDGGQTRQLKAYFAGQAILDTGAQTAAVPTSCEINLLIVRTGADSLTAIVSVLNESVTVNVVDQTDIAAGLDFTIANILKITGTSGGGSSAAGDLTGKISCVEYKPASTI